MTGGNEAKHLGWRDVRRAILFVSPGQEEKESGSATFIMTLMGLRWIWLLPGDPMKKA